MGVRLERLKVIIPAAKKRQSTDDSMNPEMKIVKSCKLGFSEVKAAMVPPRAAQKVILSGLLIERAEPVAIAPLDALKAPVVSRGWHRY